MKNGYILLMSLLSLLIYNASGQSATGGEHVKAGYGVHVTQTEPEFPGGPDSLAVFIHDNLRYPHDLIESRKGGRVLIMFIIDKDGKIVDPMVMKGVSTSIDEEALRVVKMMPDWKPATTGGMPVSRQYILPIDFMPPGS